MSQLKIVLEGPDHSGKRTVANAVESFIRANFPGKSIARFEDVRYNVDAVHSNCDVVIATMVSKE